MLLIGLHGNHNSAVCIFDLLKKKIVGNLEIERVTRKKNDALLNEDVIGHIINRFGYKTKDVIACAIGYSCNPFEKEPEEYDLEIRRSKKIFLGNEMDWIKIPHHMSHAIGAAAASKAKRLIILSCDGWGDGQNTCLYYVDKTQRNINIIKPIFAGYQHRAPACLWASICHQNYKTGALQGPGKLMALAAYGQHSNDIYASINNYASLPILKNGALESYNFDEDLTDSKALRGQNVAYALQEYTNIYMKGLVDFSVKCAEHRKLAYEEIGFSGGLALNIVATSFALREMNINNAVIPPFPNDSGLAFGNCLLAASKYFGANISEISEDFSPFMGPKYSDKSIKKDLLEVKDEIKVEYLDRNIIAERIANDIKSRYVCFRFYEGSESGPRALGNRSILYDPSDENGRKKINNIKKREWYRPFAPMILKEYAQKVLEYPIFPSSYMTTSGKIKEHWRKLFIGASHVDNSCRPQIVAEEDNPRLHEIISRFHTLSGVPGLINTSFNINGPIVETPKEAIKVFLEAEQKEKVLYLENYRILQHQH